MSGLKPWLWLGPELAHRLSPTLLKAVEWGPQWSPPEWQAFTWQGLHFKNRLGLAGGVDKDARNIRAWWTLGAGFLEVGTITPQPQPGNSGPVVDRYPPAEALWNRLGFPSQGVDRVLARLQSLTRPRLTPVFANIGKNAMTPLEKASDDYRCLMARLKSTVDGFVINISSPNTQGLRELLKPKNFSDFLRDSLTERQDNDPPIFLKLSPDMSSEELEAVLNISVEQKLNGWILTNTSQGLREGLPFETEGGVSGRPLASRSKQVLNDALKFLGKNREGRLIVSVGGVMSPADVQERLQMGADLVQIYSALIFSGPWFFRKVQKWQQPH